MKAVKIEIETLIGYTYVKLRIEIYKAEEIIIKAHNHSILKCSLVTTKELPKNQLLNTYSLLGS